MFFENPGDILKIVAKVGTAVVVVPDKVPVHIKNAIVLEPEGKSVIAIEQVRFVFQQINTRQTTDTYVVIRPADAMSEAAANALLKNLEEPRDKVHFVLVTNSLSQILPTILSRAAVYILREQSPVDGPIAANEKDKLLAKRLLAAKGSELVDIAEEIAKKKDGVRAYAMNILAISIEMLYKTYFITGKDVFVRKLPGFLEAYENISKNGNVKLQIVSNLC